ncbi:hypothetical protein Pmar_PMAR024194, partial [Perkinsus marinus ATCC 50983]
RLRNDDGVDTTTSFEFFRHEVFEKALDTCAESLQTRFFAIKEIESRFSVLRRFWDLEEQELRDCAYRLSETYATDGINTAELGTELLVAHECISFESKENY